MNRKTVALLLSGIVLVILLGFVFLPHMMDETRQGRLIASELADATGQRVRIEGPISVSLLPTPHITIKNLKIIALDGKVLLLEAPETKLKVGFLSLLEGDPEINEINLVRPRIFIARTETGELNWHPDLSKSGALSVHHTSITDGQIVFKNGDKLENFTSVYGDLHLPDGLRYLGANFEANWRSSPVSLQLNLTAPLGNNLSPIALTAEIGAAKAKLTASGYYDTKTPLHPLKIDLIAETGKTKTLLALATAAGFFDEAPQDAALNRPFTMTASLSGENGKYTFDSFNAALGPYTLKGTTRIQTTPRLGISIAGHGNRMDLAGWTSLTSGIEQGTLVIPKSLLMAFDVDFPAITYGAIVATNVTLRGDINNGILRIAEGSATLPGESRVAIKGIFTTEQGKPVDVDSNVSLDTVRLRDLLKGLNLSPPEDIDQGALSQIQFVASVRGPWGKWGIPALHLTLDGMDINGQISAADDNDVFNASLAIDSLDINRYLANAPLPLPLEEAASTGNQTTDHPRPFLPSWLWTLPRTNMDILFKQLRMGEYTAESVNLRALLLPNLLTITSLDTPDFGGNHLRLSGSYSPNADTESDLTLALSTENFPRLRTSFLPVNQLLPSPVLPLIDGAADLTIRWHTTSNEQQCLQSVRSNGSKLDIVTTANDTAPPHWKARLSHPESTILLNKLTPSLITNPDTILGAFDVYAEGQQDESTGSWTLSNIQGQSAGLTLRTGTLELAPISKAAPLPLVITRGDLTLANGSLDLLGETLNPFGLSRFVQGTANITIERLALLGETLTDGTSTLTLRNDGTLSLDSLTGSFMEGTLTAKGEAANTADRPIKGELHLADTSIDKSFGSRVGLSGNLDLTLRFETSGINTSTRLANLEGDGEFTLEGGSFTGTNLESIGTKITTAIKRGKALDLDDIFDRGGKTGILSFGGNLSIEDGIITTEGPRFRALSGSAEITKAEVDLKSGRIDSTATVTLENPPDAPPFTLSLYGALDNIRAAFDSSILSEWIERQANKTTTSRTQGEEDKARTVKETSPAATDDIDEPTEPTIIRPGDQNPAAGDGTQTQDAPPSANPLTEKQNPYLPSPNAPATGNTGSGFYPDQQPAPAKAPPTMDEMIGATVPAPGTDTQKPESHAPSAPASPNTPPPASPDSLINTLLTE